jgi:phage terminase large subunit GpA-like protein
MTTTHTSPPQQSRAHLRCVVCGTSTVLGLDELLDSIGWHYVGRSWDVCCGDCVVMCAACHGKARVDQMDETERCQECQS